MSGGFTPLSLLGQQVLLDSVPRGDYTTDSASGYAAPRSQLFIPPPPLPPVPKQEVLMGDYAAQLESVAAEAIQQKQWQRAEESLRQMLRTDPNHRNATIALANVLLQTDRPTEAIELLNAQAAHFAGDLEMEMLRGRAFLAAKSYCAARQSFETVRDKDPAQPDLNLFLGTTLLQLDQPMTAWSVLSEGTNSSLESEQYQQLARAAALARVGQFASAEAIYSHVAEQAQSEDVRTTALERQQELADAIYGPKRYYGLLKATQRYDDNTGIIPTSNIFEAPAGRVPSYGALELANVNYDLYRSYESTMAVGYNGLFTQNYDSAAEDFDLQDQCCYLAADRRFLSPFWGLPCVAVLRGDYDNLIVGGVEVLQRYGPAATLVARDSDYTLLSGSFRFTKFEFVNQPPGVEESPVDSDSDNFEAGILRQWQEYDRDLTWQLGYYYSRNLSNGTDFDYHGHRVQFGAAYEFPDESILSTNLQYFFRDYENEQTSGGFRDDNELLVGAIYARPIRENIYLTVEYAYDLNDSTLAANAYNRNVIEIGMIWNFGKTERDPCGTNYERWLRR